MARLRSTMRSRPLLRRALIAAALLAMSLFTFATSSRAQAIELAVEFHLTDLDYQPIAAAPVRLVLGASPDWQRPTAGQRFVTDAAGQHRLTLATTLDATTHQRPTNFLDSLFRRAEPADHLLIAAELAYAGAPRLYVLDVYRFRRDGDVLLGRFRIFAADASGAFTLPAERLAHGDWRLADPSGLVFSGPGHDTTHFSLQPDASDPSGQRWTLQLGFRRSPEPVRR